jgi:hypothetical protein
VFAILMAWFDGELMLYLGVPELLIEPEPLIG